MAFALAPPPDLYGARNRAFEQLGSGLGAAFSGYQQRKLDEEERAKVAAALEEALGLNRLRRAAAPALPTPSDVPPAGLRPDMADRMAERERGIAERALARPAEPQPDLGRLLSGVTPPEPPGQRAAFAPVGPAREAAIDPSRPRLANPDGSFSTEESMSFDVDGQHVLVPSIVGGRRLSPQEALQAWREGRNPEIGRYGTAEEATAASQARSARIGQAQGPASGVGPEPTDLETMLANARGWTPQASGPQMAGPPADEPDRFAAISGLLRGLTLEQLRALQGSLLARQLEPRKPIAVQKGTTLLDPDTFEPRYTAPEVEEPYTLSPGQERRVGNRVIASRPSEPKATTPSSDYKTWLERGQPGFGPGVSETQAFGAWQDAERQRVEQSRINVAERTGLLAAERQMALKAAEPVPMEAARSQQLYETASRAAVAMQQRLADPAFRATVEPFIGPAGTGAAIKEWAARNLPTGMAGEPPPALTDLGQLEATLNNVILQARSGQAVAVHEGARLQKEIPNRAGDKPSVYYRKLENIVPTLRIIEQRTKELNALGARGMLTEEARQQVFNKYPLPLSGPVAPQSPAGPGGEATKTIGGRTFIKRGGQWLEVVP